MSHVFTQANIFSAQIALSNPVRGEYTWYIFPCGQIKTADLCPIFVWLMPYNKTKVREN